MCSTFKPVKPVVALFFGALCAFMTQISVAGSTDRELVFLNWADYIDPELVKKFEQQYRVKLRQPYFDNDDNRTDMLLETDTEGYDLVIVDTPSLNVYRKAGWLEKIDTTKIPNFRHINLRWLESAGEGREYSVPYFWGTLGIAYRKDLLARPPEKWMDLFRPTDELQNKIGMYRNTIDIIAAALKSLGYSINDKNSKVLDDVEQLINEQKPYVKTYDYLSLQEDSALVKGDIYAGMFYSGDALMVKEHNDSIEYVVPDEGTMIWVDHMVVMKSSKNKQLAWQFINFLNEPSNAAQLAEYTYSSTPNTAAEKLLPAEYLEDPVIFPEKDVLAKSEFNLPLPARIVKKRNRIVNEVIQ